jgi:MFS family permease
MAPAPRSGAASDALSELDVDSGNADSVGLLDALLSLNYDLRVLIGCKSLRLFGDGMLGVIFVLFLEACKFDEEKMGTLLSLTLIGNSVSSLLVTTYADRVGRKRMLLFCSMNAVATGAIFSVTSSFYVLLITSVCGMISTSGNEAGPFQPIELAALSEGLSERLRTRLITFYLLFSMIASAFGALLSGLTIQYLIDNSGFHELSAYRVIMCAFTFINVALTCLYSTLTPSIEVHQENDHSKVYTEASSSKGSSFFGLHKSKVLVLQLSVVFALDSFASSFITESLTTAWFQKTYDTSDSVLGFVVFLCNLLGGLSTVMAPRIADYLGLILAMVCTHLPSNLLVILVPLMPNEPLAVAVLALKYCIGEMDTPIRHAL